ncbi:DNA-binding transcriptional dual regulator Crp [compost metagenome]
MTKKLIDHFKKYVEIAPNDEPVILSYFEPLLFAKKENLMHDNSQCKFHYFVENGCLRMFYICDKGIEQTIQFAIEDWWITDYLAFEKQAQTEFIIQAVEKTEVLAISYKNQEKLLKKYPQLEHYFRLIYQRAYAATQHRSKYLHTLSSEQLYHLFNDKFPEFTRRVPQHILASYLNMTPEYLSEIKAKKRSTP